MTCTDCGGEVDAALVPAGTTTCVACRLKQIEAMPLVEAVMEKVDGRVTQVYWPMNSKQIEGVWNYEEDDNG